MVPVRVRSCLAAGLLAATLAIPARGASGGSLDRIAPGSGPLGGARAARVSSADLLHTSQVFAIDGAAEVAEGLTAEGQARLAWDNLARTLRYGGSDADLIVRLNAVVVDAAAAVAVGAVLRDRLPEADRPAVTLVEGALPVARALLALDAVAMVSAVPEERDSPVAPTPWLRGQSHGSRLPAGSRVYISGRAADGTPAAAAGDVLGQIDRTFDFMGLRGDSVIQLKCFMRPVVAAREVHARIAAHFDGQPPPVVFVEWRNRQAIEIEAIAAAPDHPGGTAVEYLTPPWDRASPIFARIARAHHPASVYLSTMNGRTGRDGASQVREMFEELAALLPTVGSDFRHLAKATYYVADDVTSATLNAVRPEYYPPDRPPAASKASVRGVAVAGQRLAVDMIAVPAN